VLLFYLDEFGEGSLKRARVGNRWVLDPSVSQWFILAAVGVAETSRKDLAEDITDAKDRCFAGWQAARWKESEIKGRHLHNAVTRLANRRLPSQPGYRNLTLSRVRRLCGDLRKLFMKFRPIVYSIAVDKQALARRNNPWEPVGVAYAFLQQRLALLVDEVYGDAEGALMVADEQQSHEKLFRSGRMRAIRSQITAGLPLQPNFDLVLDRPVWIDSDLHPLDREILQLPDVVAYATAELLLTGATPTGDAHMWAEVRSCFATHWTTGLVPDGGVAIYPRPAQYPPI
jgi:hypothetical protein